MQHEMTAYFLIMV